MTLSPEREGDLAARLQLLRGHLMNHRPPLTQPKMKKLSFTRSQISHQLPPPTQPDT